MGRVNHSKPAKQAVPSNGVRGSKVAKQRKNHKLVIESESKDEGKEQSRAVLSFRADPPPGYTFIPAGNPQLTAALKEFAKRGNHQILAVTTTPHASRHELSREVHRIGFHFPTEVVSQVCNHYGIRLTSGGKLVEEKDDDKLFMRLYQKGQLVLDEKVRDQVTINTEAKQIIQDLFPNIPDNDLFQIIKTAFQLGDGKVGTADEIPLVRRAQLSVVAHIRHTFTNYDKLLRSVPYSEARHRVENITLQKLIDWRGDGKDDQQAMDDTLREVVVISDEEDSDDLEAGQLLENNDLQVQPVRRPAAVKPATNGRPHSPVEMYSDDEAPRGYRYMPQVVRRYPAQDSLTVSAARQQSRYAVWDRVRQEYRSTAAPPSGRVMERILIDEPQIGPQGSYAREPLYIPEPAPRRVTEPVARIVTQPSQSMYTRAVDGNMYERITSVPQPQVAPVPSTLRRAYTPPRAEYVYQNLDTRQPSPRPQSLRMHRRTESFDNHDGSVLPSIESSNSVYASPNTRRNPFEDSKQVLRQYRNSGAFENNQRQGPLIDLTDSAEQASKRRRVEATPPSPYLIRPAGDGMRGTALVQNDENTRPSSQRLIPLENPAVSYQSQRTYEKVEQRLQPSGNYRDDLSQLYVSSPRGTVVRQLPPHGVNEPHHPQPSRRIEFVNVTNDVAPSSYRAVDHPSFQAYAPNGGDNRTAYVASQGAAVVGRPSALHTEPPARYVRTEVRNPFETSNQSNYYMQERPELMQREYYSMAAPPLPAPSRDLRPVQYQPDERNYQDRRMVQIPPSTVYR